MLSKFRKVCTGMLFSEARMIVVAWGNMGRCLQWQRSNLLGLIPCSPVQQHRAQSKLSSEQIHGLSTFHPQNEGVNFRQAYRWGLRGPYLLFTQVDHPLLQLML